MKNMLWRRVTGLKKGFTNLRSNRRMRNTATAEPSARPLNTRPGRVALIALGFLCVAIGLVGIVVPVLPTTVFLLIAAWAFSRSSERFQR